MLSEFAEVFERNIPVAKCSSLISNYQKILAKISFVISDIVVKKTNRLWFCVVCTLNLLWSHSAAPGDDAYSLLTCVCSETDHK